MDKLDGLTSVVLRVCFFLGFALLILVVAEELLRYTGVTLLARSYSQETVLGVSVSFFIVAIALLLRQIRNELKGGSPATR